MPKDKKIDNIGIDAIPIKKDDLVFTKETQKKIYNEQNKQFKGMEKGEKAAYTKSVLQNVVNEDISSARNLIQLEIARRQIQLELARKSLLHYIMYMKPDYVFGKFNLDLIDKLQQVYDGKIKNLILNMPPRHGKSETIRYFITFVIGNRPYEEVVNVGYNIKFGESLGVKIKQITESEKFKNVFPNFEIDKNTTETKGDWGIKCVDKEGNNIGGYVLSTGIGGGLTGRGMTLGIIDDPIKDAESAKSQIDLEKVREWFSTVFSTRTNPHKNQYRGHSPSKIIVMTRWSTQDLVGFIDQLIEEGVYEDDEYERVIYKAFNEEGEILFPERFTREEYEKARGELGVFFDAMYQQDPIALEGIKFNRQHFRYFLSSDLEKVGSDLHKDNFVFGCFIDPAFSTSKKSDDTVAMIIGYNIKTKGYYVIDIVGGKIAPSDAYVKIINMLEYWKSKGYNIKHISMEQATVNKNQTQFKTGFIEYMKETGKIYMIKDYSSKEEKKSRILNTLEPMFSYSMIHFRDVNKEDIKDSNLKQAFKMLENQLLRFPSTTHDDYPDTLTQGVQVLSGKRSAEEAQRRNNVERYKDVVNPITNEIQRVRY